MEDLELKYKDLLYEYNKLRNMYNNLKCDFNKLNDKLWDANFKIENELEPMIKSKNRSYDNWVTNSERG